MRIVSILKHLRDTGAITLKEYNKAKDYYARLTGADIVIANQVRKHEAIISRLSLHVF